MLNYPFEASHLLRVSAQWMYHETVATQDCVPCDVNPSMSHGYAFATRLSLVVSGAHNSPSSYTTLLSLPAEYEPSGVRSMKVTDKPSTNEDIIFKAAVVAVPIAGGLILIILILMAIKMLREDRRHARTGGGLAKAHTFIQQHFVKKDSTRTVSAKRKPIETSEDSTDSRKGLCKEVRINCERPYTDESLEPLQSPHRKSTARTVNNNSSLSIV